MLLNIYLHLNLPLHPVNLQNLLNFPGAISHYLARTDWEKLTASLYLDCENQGNGLMSHSILVKDCGGKLQEI